MKNTIKTGTIIFTFVFFATLSFLVLKDGNESSAASTKNFRAGNIISDYVMSNYSTMTEADIQNFLKSKNSCSKTIPTSYKNEGNGIYSTTFSEGGKTYYYHGKNGKFVCLADEIFGNGAEYGEKVKNGETAAHIIWQAAQDYKINPQVLLVLLEKEQSLITDNWPNNYQYRAATGYGCPDTAACDAKYYGLKNQIRNAANLFRTVLDGGWTNYPVGNNYIKYNPDASCGGSTVNIENLATSALYRYTPYQPNAETLSAGYGTAPCGAYGNRNFYLFFMDWFGDPTTGKPADPTSQKNEPKGMATTSNTEASIQEGLYTINLASNKYQVIDIQNGVKNAVNGTNIQLYEDNSTLAQVWKIIKNEKTNDYSFINPSTGKVIDVFSALKRVGTNIHLYESNGTCAQRWKIEEIENNKYIIRSACSELVLETINTYNGANIQLGDYSKKNNQIWTFYKAGQHIENGIYEIQSFSKQNLVLDIQNGAERAKNETNIQLYESNQTNAQKWQVTYNSKDGTYEIINPYTKKAIDVAGAGIQNWTNIQLYESNQTCAQKWFILKRENHYVINSSCSSLVLDVQNGIERAKNGANIQLYEPNQTNAQKWVFKKLN